MHHKTSLLIYRAQVSNVKNIWSSKARLIKNLTPLFRSLTESDFSKIEEFNTQHKALVDETNLLINPVLIALNSENDPVNQNQLKGEISEFKLNYLKKKSTLKSLYKNDKIKELDSKTQILTVLYCTWSEAVFKKLIHTPHGLTIEQRQNTFGSNVEDKWINLIKEVLNRIPIDNNQDDVNQIKLELEIIARKYIIEPSKLRNKIMHGQWSEALNSSNRDLIIETSFLISKLDIVELNIAFDIHNIFIEILEQILESNRPEDMITNRHDSFLFLKDKLDKFILKTSDWSSRTRSVFLKQRDFDSRNLKLAKILQSKNIALQIIEEITGVRLK